ncbi:RNA-directed DNA polymerase, eukaryota [Tanacetum coccineum]
MLEKFISDNGSNGKVRCYYMPLTLRYNSWLLYIDKIDFGPTPFKLYNSWLLRDGFDNLIKEEWELLDFNIKCHEKFRRLKDKIKQWSKTSRTLEETEKNRGDSPFNYLVSPHCLNNQDKDCLIINRINNGQWSWNWSRTNLGVRNLAYLCDMLNEIGQLNIDVNEDTCTWSLGPNGTFTVKDARYRIDQNILPTLAHATTWDKSIPRKVNVFMWRLSLDRLPHRLNLSSRGMDIPAISCPSCNANVESANHVFFECDIATDMWKLVFRWCDIPLFQASSWDSFNDWIISWHASKEKKHRFYVITTSVLWWLWRYRNSVTFNSQPLRKSDLFDNVRFSSFSWLHNRDHMKLSWNDWLMYPLSITRNGNG